jgi:hypothetical protein
MRDLFLMSGRLQNFHLRSLQFSSSICTGNQTARIRPLIGIFGSNLNCNHRAENTQTDNQQVRVVPINTRLPSLFVPNIEILECSIKRIHQFLRILHFNQSVTNYKLLKIIFLKILLNF